jgi:hypothetical protein
VHASVVGWDLKTTEATAGEEVSMQYIVASITGPLG